MPLHAAVDPYRARSVASFDDAASTYERRAGTIIIATHATRTTVETGWVMALGRGRRSGRTISDRLSAWRVLSHRATEITEKISHRDTESQRKPTGFSVSRCLCG